MSSVSGDVEMMPVGDIALWIAGKALSGTMTVKRRGVESRFTIRSGLCTRAASLDPREYLGQHLINFGYIDEEQLQRAFDTQRETHVPLGRVLVMVEAITTEQLQKVLTFKTREGLLEALCWTEGQWKVVTDVDEDRELDCDRPVDLREVYGEASARQQMWTEIRRVFPTDATRVEVLVDPSRVESGFDRRLLQLMHTGRSVGEAALELRAMDFQTYARLYDLATRQLVRPKTITQEIRVPGAPGPATLPRPPSSSSMVSPLAPPAFSGPASPAPSRVMAPLPPTVPSTPPAPVRAKTPAPQPRPPVPTPAPSKVPPPPPPPSSSSPFGQAGSSLGDDEVDFDIEEPAAAPAPPPKTPTPLGAYFGAGTYMMMKGDKVEEAPGVVIPPEAVDPEQALRLALAGRDWSEALLMSQRILERDPLNSEAIAAYRVAEVQLRRREKDSPSGGAADFDRVPMLAVARDEIAMGHLSSKERYVLSRVDSKRTLAQIAAVSPIQRAELARIVESFVQRGVLTLS
ncbi:MAG: hypothetical protein Q8O67_29375 [Deltaproteobacteria bacterium]|nr:hypothetical protein [Deltaproteobacteria bacterium]